MTAVRDVRACPRLLHGVLASILLCAPFACAELKDLMALRGALGDQYGEVALNVDMSNGVRSMELTLSPEVAEDRDRAEVAIEVARAARSAYPHAVDRWIVVFGNETNAGAFHFELSVGRYEFASNDL